MKRDKVLWFAGWGGVEGKKKCLYSVCFCVTCECFKKTRDPELKKLRLADLISVQGVFTYKYIYPKNEPISSCKSLTMKNNRQLQQSNKCFTHNHPFSCCLTDVTCGRHHLQLTTSMQGENCSQIRIRISAYHPPLSWWLHLFNVLDV